ncbi:ArsR family transcriptional regulator [Nostoc sp. 3335mG]|nr:ArsR family transcriptional regulator [Nostoc sp. 3335mG]
MSASGSDAPVAADPLALDRQLCFQFYAASNLINRLYAPVLGELGLTYPQYLVMLVLWEGDGLSVGALGRRLHLDSGTITPLLKRMEALGLVRRERDRSDERRVQVRLTEAGRALRARAISVPATMSRGHDAGELDALRETISGLVGLLAEAQARS